ncbi:MAG: class II fructose-bisphosphate aldolase [Actinobacteria bacterium]|nr:class II fructose-bisphosphate aldolase [Actinomycetota bacterium]
MFIPLKIMMDHAKQNGYSISRFAVTNLESIEAVTQAVDITDSPIVYDIYEPELKNVCQSCLEFLIKKLGSETRAPVAIFSDHVQNVETCKEIINKGYGGLMVDASKYSFEENVMITREVVDYAKQYGVFVEGELGIIESGREGDDTGKFELTDPELARDFVKRTNVDCLAIAIGVKSGFYRSTPEINFDLLKKIRNNVDVHLSLHGCSGLSEEVIKKCISGGISFTAWATDIRFVFFEKIDEIRKEKGREYVIPGNILIPARDKMKDEIINKLSQAGSIGKGSEIINFYKNRAKTDISGKYFSDVDKFDMDKLVEHITSAILKEIRSLG